ncbi:MAG: VOC family protein [Acidobacteriota bacterium]
MDKNPTDSSNVKQAVPFFMVTNMDSSLKFYTDGLGFELKMKWEPRGRIEWCWLQFDEASLMLQEYRNNVPAEKLGVGVSVVFMCNDALKIYKEIISNGLSPEEPFVGNNLWVVGLKDPDDYNIFFESPTDVPEETTYTDWIKTNKKKETREN